MKKKHINESITTSAVSPLSYIILIDAARSISKSRGYIRMIFPSENPDIIKSWFKKIVSSESYGKSKDKLESISSRFFGNPQLNSLIVALKKIKELPYSEEEKETHENDIQKIIEKISIYIKRRFTNEDFELLDSFASEINHVSEKVSEKIDIDVETLMSVTPAEPEPVNMDTEKKVSERLRNKLKKKIKEIIRTNLISNRNK